MKSMKKLLNFLFLLLIVFATLGGVGSLFYSGFYLFGVVILILGVLVFLHYIEKIKLPTKSGLF